MIVVFVLPLLLLVVVGFFNRQLKSVRTNNEENPKPLVKKSHVFFRLFEESKMCFKRVDIYIYRVYIVYQRVGLITKF